MPKFCVVIAPKGPRGIGGAETTIAQLDVLLSLLGFRTLYFSGHVIDREILIKADISYGGALTQDTAGEAASQIESVLRRYSVPDLIISSGVPATQVALMLQTLNKTYQHIAVLHETPHFVAGGSAQELTIMSVERFWSEKSKLVALSTLQAEVVSQIGLPPQYLARLPFGIHDIERKFAHSPPLASRCQSVLFPSRIAPRKNTLPFIEAVLCRNIHALRSWRLIFTGGRIPEYAAYFDEVATFVRNWHAPIRIDEIPLSPQSLRFLMRSSALSCFPSRGELLGIAAIEGQLSGCLCIASRDSGFDEALLDHQFSVHCSDSSDLVDCLANGMRDAFRSRALERMAARARQRVAHRFSFEPFAKAFLRMLSS